MTINEKMNTLANQMMELAKEMDLAASTVADLNERTNCWQMADDLRTDARAMVFRSEVWNG